MNLVDGNLFETEACNKVLDNLEDRILKTLEKGSLNPEVVLNACDKLVNQLDITIFLQAISELGIDEALGRQYIDEARQLFGKKQLSYRLAVELGENYCRPNSYQPQGKHFSVTERIAPLGVLLHIAAGNADGLPAFSVLEGLLTGNINILKLPAEEGGISVRLLLELIKVEPSLAEYIYVFDYSSKDIKNVNKLISAADAAVIWGGKEAVLAIRSLVPAHIKIIEWGHKISFAYVTPRGINEEGLRGLAYNIVSTNQLLCSSLQGIFVDTEDIKQVYQFCTSFLPILEETFQQSPNKNGIGIQSQVVLNMYTAELEGIYSPRKVFKGQNCSLIAYPDEVLETAIGFGNAWVRPLPNTRLLNVLHPYKNYLQTVGLLCNQDEQQKIAEKLFKSGVVRVCAGENMSITYCGAPHDGEYSLRRYTKVVSEETVS